MSKSQRVEESWTNHIGQVVNVGDKVLIITSGFNHSIKTRVGTFLGFIPSANGGKPQVKAKTSRFGNWVGDEDVGYWGAREMDPSSYKTGYRYVDTITTAPKGRVYALKVEEDAQ